MRHLQVGLTVLLGCSSSTPAEFTTGGGESPVAKGQTIRHTFDADPAGAAPADFISSLGEWRVEAVATASSAPNLLRQRAELNNPDFPRIVRKDLVFADLVARVRCRPESGSTDQACGMMFRFKDSDNYYITRANVLENNVRFYRVVDGDREQLASGDALVAAGEWSVLEVTARGSEITVSWRGTRVLSATDATYARGKVGLWTKADSITAFDDFEITAE
jgi:hypothetical protein